MSGRSDISVSENSDPQLSRLAAASAVYGRGKQILGLQIALTVLGGFVSSITAAVLPQSKVWVVFYSFVVALLDGVVLEKLQLESRKKGARIQELFDCELFSIPWRNLVSGDQPTREFLTEEADKYKRKHRDLTSLRNWYSPSVSRLPLPLGRLICQRTNAWWDAGLRKRYTSLLTTLLWGLCIFAFALALHRGMTLDKFVLTVVAPVTPAALWGVREIRKHSSATLELEHLQGQIDKQWQSALDGTLAGDDLVRASISIQEQLFYFRSKNPFVFNWVYRLLRSRQENTMHQIAEQLVAEAERVHS